MTETAPSAQPAGRLWPVRLILLGIVFALLLPGAMFCGVLLDRIASGERSRSIETAHATVLRAADTLDREIDNLSAALLALSTSPLLPADDLDGFRTQATAVGLALGQTVQLLDTDGHLLMTTHPAPAATTGGERPDCREPALVRRLLQTGRPAVSDLVAGASAGPFTVCVAHPVRRDGRTIAVLMFQTDPMLFSNLLKQQGLPPGWLLAVADQKRRVVARTIEPERFIGQPATADMQDHAAFPEATWVGATLDGTPVLASLVHLRRADWTVTVGAPLSKIEAPLWNTMGLLAVTGALALALACLLAWLLGRSLTRPLRLLAGSGPAIAQGLPVPGVHTRILEVDAVSRALVSATHDLRARADALALERTTALRAANQRLRDEAAARAKAEEQLRQVQKMEAVGQLTGGIAHDFNNLLTIVIGSLDLLRRRSEDERARRLIDNALDGAARAATLTARLLAFSRRQPLKPEAVDVNRLVSGMTDLLRRTLGEGMQVETVLAGGLWQTHADANQLENALLNLAVNARDAVAATGRRGGHLVIRTSNAVLDAASVAHEGDVQPGDYVEIAVSDNGMGMPPDVLAHVFEPFYTTKPQGQGTGLGLSQVHGFVKQSGGHVAIRTQVNEGTTVSIYMPRHDGALAAQLAEHPGPEPTTHARVVLVVEDDSGVRRTSVEALRELGHSVLEADSPAAALRLLRAHPEVALLFTDVRLPEIGGPALAEAARALHPGLKVLFVSGYTGASATEGVNPLLQKPFTLQQLAAMLSDVLDGEA